MLVWDWQKMLMQEHLFFGQIYPYPCNRQDYMDFKSLLRTSFGLQLDLGVMVSNRPTNWTEDLQNSNAIMQTETTMRRNPPKSELLGFIYDAVSSFVLKNINTFLMYIQKNDSFVHSFIYNFKPAARFVLIFTWIRGEITHPYCWQKNDMLLLYAIFPSIISKCMDGRILAFPRCQIEFEL